MLATAASAGAAAAAAATDASAPEEALTAAKRASLVAFVRACEAGDVHTVELALHETPELLEAVDDHGRTPAHFAARSAAVQIFSSLKRSGGSLVKVDHGGRTPLVYAARHGKAAALRALLGLGVSPSLPVDKFGLSPLHHAVLSKSVESVGVLLEAGGDWAAKDTAGNSALELAAQLASPSSSKLGVNSESTEEDWKMHALLRAYAKGEKKPKPVQQPAAAQPLQGDLSG